MNHPILSEKFICSHIIEIKIYLIQTKKLTIFLNMTKNLYLLLKINNLEYFF